MRINKPMLAMLALLLIVLQSANAERLSLGTLNGKINALEAQVNQQASVIEAQDDRIEELENAPKAIEVLANGDYIGRLIEISDNGPSKFWILNDQLYLSCDHPAWNRKDCRVGKIFASQGSSYLSLEELMGCIGTT